MIMAAGVIYVFFDAIILLVCGHSAVEMARAGVFLGSVGVLAPLTGLLADALVIRTGHRARTGGAPMALLGVGFTLARPAIGVVAQVVFGYWSQIALASAALWVPPAIAGVVMAGFALLWTRAYDELPPF